MVQEHAGVRALDVDLAEGGAVHDADAGCGRRAHSRSTAASMSSPRRGSTRAVSTARRPRTRRRARRARRGWRWCGPGRTAPPGPGRPGRRTATGVYGGRKVVVPSSAMSTPRASATMPEARTPEVLPWSWAVPMVVYRLTCSTDRRPAPVARSTSPTVASRCRSTNRVQGRPAGSGTDQSTVVRRRPAGAASTLGGGPRTRPAREPECAQRRGGGARAPARRHREVELAVAAPATLDRRAASAGHERTELGVVAQLSAGLAEQVHRGVPAAGDQQEVAVEPAPLPTRRRRRRRAHAVTRSVPSVPVTTLPVRTSMPRSRRSSAAMSGACGRVSTTAATCTPGVGEVDARRRRRCRWW